MIEIKNLTVKNEGKTYLDDVSFTMARGGIHGLFGVKGSGKDILIDVMCIECGFNSGRVAIDGIDSKDQIAYRRKFYVLDESSRLYIDMTVTEYLYFLAELQKIPFEVAEKKIKTVIGLMGLENIKDTLIGNITPTQELRAKFALLLFNAANVEVYILNDALDNVDKKTAEELKGIIKRLAEKKTVLLASTKLSVMEDFCDTLTIISNGRVVASDSVENLRARLAKTQVLVMSVRGSEESVLSAVSSIEGIIDCSVCQGTGGVLSVKLEYDGKTEIRDSVFAALAKEGCPILSMAVESLSLSDVCLKISDASETVSSEQSSQKRRNKK